MLKITQISTIIWLKLHPTKARILINEWLSRRKCRGQVDVFWMLMNGINKRHQMVHVRVGIDAVTKVCYVALSAKLHEHFFGLFWNVFLSRKNKHVINSLLSVLLPRNQLKRTQKRACKKYEIISIKIGSKRHTVTVFCMLITCSSYQTCSTQVRTWTCLSETLAQAKICASSETKAQSISRINVAFIFKTISTNISDTRWRDGVTGRSLELWSTGHGF